MPSNNPDDRFVPVVNKKQNRANRQRAVVGGKPDDSVSFKGVAKEVVFCVSRLEPGTSTATVTDYLSSKGINVVSCSALEPKDNIDNNDMPTVQSRRRLVAMRITVTSGAVGKFMSSDIWPEGVSVRKWIFKQRDGNISRSQTMPQRQVNL